MSLTHAASSSVPIAARAGLPGAAKPTPQGAWGTDGFGFGDILDMLNPLQHIPVVSTFYRSMTGDEISPAARIVGDGALGGLAGLASGVANAIWEHTTGKDIGQSLQEGVVAALTEEPAAPPAAGPATGELTASTALTSTDVAVLSQPENAQDATEALKSAYPTRDALAQALTTAAERYRNGQLDRLADRTGMMADGQA